MGKPVDYLRPINRWEVEFQSRAALDSRIFNFFWYELFETTSRRPSLVMQYFVFDARRHYY